jgi:phosphoglycolate phosphatase
VSTARTLRARSRRGGAPAIKAILFDKDGTLIDFRKTWLAAYRGAAAELAEAAGLGPGFVDVLLARHGYDPRADTFTAESPLLWATTRDQAALWGAEPELAGVGDVAPRLERHFTDLDAYPPVPVVDLAPLFERLRRRGLRLGVATMDSTAALEATLARFAVRPLLDFAAGCDGGHGSSRRRAWCWASAPRPAWRRPRSPWSAIIWPTWRWRARPAPGSRSRC